MHQIIGQLGECSPRNTHAVHFYRIMANQDREIAPWPTPALDFKINGMSHGLSGKT